MTDKTKKGLKRLKKIIFPDKCPICGTVRPQWFSELSGEEGTGALCPGCRGRIKHVKEPLCKKCGRSLTSDEREYCSDCEKYEHNFAEGRSIYEYDGDMKSLVYRFKYSNRRDFAELFVAEMGRDCRNWLESKEIDMVVPIPLHPDKQRKRGYNQSEVFGAALAGDMGLAFEKDLLLRNRYTSPQKGLSRPERINNLKNAFILKQSGVKSSKMNILLVDDIYTTGATVDAAAAVLRDVANVYFLCICNGRR
ncbi:MAG: double zinc ribbon domain-containing protein [Lachnospiraceae bacterium]|nr:double zinc ribbon domain-containing protein [Lachnospiraceae bacterium]